MTQSVTAFPLHWPEGRPRTKYRGPSRFDVTFAKAVQELEWELERLGARHPVLSTNCELRLDGRPRANQEPADPGVAVYFERKGRQMVFACDKYDRVKDNIRAVGKTIEALRGIERWGTGDMMERAFTGFEQLPGPDAVSKRHWRQVFGIARGETARPITRLTIEAMYRALARERHPDHGGSDALMAELNRAREEAMEEISP